jgi:hypothetical protein
MTRFREKNLKLNIQHGIFSFKKRGQALDFYLNSCQKTETFMKDTRCFLCKYSGFDELNTAVNLLYTRRGKALNINLCFTHGLELFKMGQTNFALKYGNHFKGRYGLSEEDDIIEVFTGKDKTYFD